MLCRPIAEFGRLDAAVLHRRGYAFHKLTYPLAGHGHRGDHRRPQFPLQLLDVDFDALVLCVVPNVQRDDKGNVFFKEMQSQVKVPWLNSTVVPG